MTLKDQPREPKEGDYAVLDEPGGWRVICNRRFPGHRYCHQVLALIELAPEGAGRRRRMVRLISVGWNEIDGVWRLNAGDKLRLKAGLPPRRQAAFGPLRVWEGSMDDEGLVYPFERVARPRLPALMECPWCGHKRRLDGARRDAVGAEADDDPGGAPGSYAC
jgi:hypothetical protein